MAKKINIPNIAISLNATPKEILNYYTEHIKTNSLKKTREKKDYTSKEKRERKLSIVLFIITFISTTVTQWNPNLNFKSALTNGLYFSVPLMTILLFHELGHYITAKIHKVKTSPPFFIPMPFISLIGTLGAIIIMRDRIKNRKALIDIGISGPIMSFILSLPVLIIGIKLSEIVEIAQTTQPSSHGEVLIKFGDSIITYLISNTMLSNLNDKAIIAHPLYLAAWVGLFVTGLNLIPVGQLDGGHIAYAMFGKRYNLISILISFIFISLGTIWLGWLFWGILILLIIKPVHPDVESLDKLNLSRKILGVIGLLIFIITFVPKPIEIVIK